jgi:NADH-quinone oxidoreductase subunit G
VSTHAEAEGTFTNRDGRVQRFSPALDAPGMTRPAWLILGALAGEKGGGAVARTAAEAFSGLGGSVPAFSGIDYDAIGSRGAVINESVSLTGD